jgi:ribosomal protein L11 methyltransferase
MTQFIARFPAPASALERDLLLADLQDAGTLGVLEGDSQWQAWFSEEEVARRFGAVEIAPSIDFVQQAREQWHPRLVGDRFFLTPRWSEDPTPDGRIRLHYRDGMACGTGEHTATRISLLLLERCMQPGDRVLDVGCGSGILGAAARLLGASRVWGCDIEEAEVRIANEAFVGSARAVRSGAVDLVIANINAQVLAGLAPDLHRVATRTVALSGFPAAEAPLLEQAMGRPASFSVDLEGWRGLAFTRSRNS